MGEGRDVWYNMRMKGSVKTTQVESPRQEDDVRGGVVEMMIEQYAKGIRGLDRDILEWNVPEEALL